MHVIALVLSLGLALGPAPSEGPAAPVSAPVSDASVSDPAGSDDPSSDAPASDPEPAAPETDPSEPAADSTPEPGPEPTPEPAPEPEPEPTPEPEPEPTPEVPTQDEAALAASTSTAPPARRDRLGCDGSRRCRRMSAAGIAVASVGLISVGAGIGMLIKNDVVIESNPIYVTTTRPPGLVSVTIGTGVVLTSVLMLVAAHRGYKQLPDEASRGPSPKQARLQWQAGGLALRF